MSLLLLLLLAVPSVTSLWEALQTRKPLGHVFLLSQYKAGQYEMMVEEADPEPAAVICRFPEELDLRM